MQHVFLLLRVADYSDLLYTILEQLLQLLLRLLRLTLRFYKLSFESLDPCFHLLKI